MPHSFLHAHRHIHCTLPNHMLLAPILMVAVSPLLNAPIIGCKCLGMSGCAAPRQHVYFPMLTVEHKNGYGRRLCVPALAGLGKLLKHSRQQHMCNVMKCVFVIAMAQHDTVHHARPHSKYLNSIMQLDWWRTLCML